MQSVALLQAEKGTLWAEKGLFIHSGGHALYTPSPTCMLPPSFNLLYFHVYKDWTYRILLYWHSNKLFD